MTAYLSLVGIAAQAEPKAELIVQTGHSASVRSVIFSPNGKTLASSSWDSTIRLWDVESGKELRTIRNSADALAFSPDGKILASAGYGYTVEFWDVASGEKLRTLNGHSSTVESISFSPDGRTLASGSLDSAIKIWDVATGKVLKTLTGHLNFVRSVIYSPDGKTLISGSGDKTIKFWDVATGEELKILTGHTSPINSVAISPDGKTLASGGDEAIKLWDVASGKELKTFERSPSYKQQVKFSPDGKMLVSGGDVVKLWDIESGKELRTLTQQPSSNSIAFSPDGKTLASGYIDNSLTSVNLNNTFKLWEIATGKEIRTFTGNQKSINKVAFSPDGKTVAAGNWDSTIKLLDVENRKELKTLSKHSSMIESITFSPDGRTVASGSDDNTIKLWDVDSGKELKALTEHSGWVFSVKFSPDGKILASGSGDNTVKLWDVESGRTLRTLTGHSNLISSVAFSSDGKTLASSSADNTTKIWDVVTGKEIKSYGRFDFGTHQEIYSRFPTLIEALYAIVSDKYRAQISDNGKIRLFNENEPLATLATIIVINENDWVVTTPEGRFDTNKSLDNIEGLHWVISDQPFKPVPLDVFMRQYYEPNLLQRILKGEEFKPLPPITEINRVQPIISIKEIKSVSNSSDLVNITVEVTRVIEELSLNGNRQTVSSGAYDLRLFRDGQLVGTSAKKADLEEYIKAAALLVEKDQAAKTVLNTEEDKAWRKANDIFAMKSENVKFISPEMAQYTFRNVKLPRDGRKTVAFTAYAFNSDKVKSATTEAVKFTVPNAVADTPKKGRAFVVSIGVNASENPAYDLRYAANDARKMQEIVGERLKAESGKYSEVIQVSLVSDYGKDGKPAENNAQKAIIKGVFSLLAGNEKEIPENILKQIPNRERVKQVEPEDTLIITYAGHGYADRSGIFYLLPYDIGASTRQLTTETLQKTISSDELSLWLRDITAAEMIFIIDACHSSAAVQGDGFKPGPMGSRGLGQLAYDKDMKILSATQADNVALELNSLEQGLLSYALIQDGIIKSLADADKNKQLFSTEWLSFAEKRVPELYREIKDGKRGVMIDGKNVKADERDAVIVNLSRQKSKLNLQQPSLFDFRRRNVRSVLLDLP